MNVYHINSLPELLASNSYPGRGIVIGKSADGSHMAIAYFIMGRSPNSRNRIFTPTDDGIRTQAYDPAQLEDPSLIIYHPVRRVADKLVVTNGDQTDTIRDALITGSCFESALLTRKFEPDAPNFTPRISGILYPDGTYSMAILKSADTEGSACTRHFFCYPPLAGMGHFLHTYNCDGNPLPTFTGEPKRIATPNDIDDFANTIWDNLNEENKISLYVAFTNIETGATTEKIINKHSIGGQA